MKLVKKTELSEMELNKFLLREIAILQKISHPNILDVYQLWGNKVVGWGGG